MLICTRELLKAGRTYYVRTDGNDSNNGLTNDAGGAFLTIQKAIDVTINTLDFGGYDVTIQVGDGTYTAESQVYGPQTGRGKLTIQGNAVTPGNVLISVTSANCFLVSDHGALVLKDMELRTVTSGICLCVTKNSLCEFQNLNFGASATAHVAALNGSFVEVTGNYTISGSVTNHALVGNCSSLYIDGRTITLTGTPNWSNSFAFLTDCAAFRAAAITFTGAATGSRYLVAGNSVIQTFGQGQTYLPGDANGVLDTGGVYS